MTRHEPEPARSPADAAQPDTGGRAGPGERERIKAHFMAERGYWRPWTEALLVHNPAFLERYASYAGHPARHGPLSERMVELIYVALDASATHLFGAGLRTHMERALAVGATPADIFDVLHLVTAQGLDAVCQSVDILASEAGWQAARIETAGESTPVSQPRERARRLLPGRNAAIDHLAVADPGYLEAMLDFLEQGRPGTGLAPVERAIVETALHACFTGFDPAALRSAVRGALDLGASDRALLQAIQLGAHLAVHGAALGAGTFDALVERR
ncbi:carboxymuconolactone decarboxylase family protein [Verticiella sediminum]|uniref:Carboxymuconolactone decarboxylase family protein n=1 Tax=Verticiella sediminum TaxID=1247510 RepID=A0A556AIQ7_9BURK|nr:carboxymuconolactone decarboxylase family protein [Verticiella sediminum]TSH92773.1 carboxymuconolactone decarboxylase family protein [Verticiella sediminum]